MEDFSQVIEDIQKELEKALKQMAKTKKLEEKIQLSILIKNLSESLGVYFGFASDMMFNDMGFPELDDDDEDMPF